MRMVKFSSYPGCDMCTNISFKCFITTPSWHIHDIPEIQHDNWFENYKIVTLWCLHTSVHNMRDRHLLDMNTGGKTQNVSTWQKKFTFSTSYLQSRLPFYHTETLSEVINLHSGKWFGQNICSLISCTNIF